MIDIEYSPSEFIDNEKMKLLCETDHKIIYIYNDLISVRIFHSYSADFERHYT